MCRRKGPSSVSTVLVLLSLRLFVPRLDDQP